MLIKRPSDIKPSEITDRGVYLNRRHFMGIAAAGASGLMSANANAIASDSDANGEKLEGVTESPLSTDEELTPYSSITTYNNFYEFGTDKKSPAKYAKKFKTTPWSLEVSGECEKPGTFALEDFIKPHALEERIYRLRCVEAWSMVVPWVGIPLADVIKRFSPTSNAKYVAFQTLHDEKRMPGQMRPVLPWPYVEGLRMDEAMHPLTLLAVGLYGEVMPNQNGAPIRLVVPWKYGFKSIKSVVALSFVEKEPPATWNQQAPREYGFYSNVNPQKSHPRWSQAKERRIGEIFKRETLMFNGYADQVASLYDGMDLDKYF